MCGDPLKKVQARLVPGGFDNFEHNFIEKNLFLKTRKSRNSNILDCVLKVSRGLLATASYRFNFPWEIS